MLPIYLQSIWWTGWQNRTKRVHCRTLQADVPHGCTSAVAGAGSLLSPHPPLLAVATYATRHKVLREIRSTLLAEAHLSPCSSGDAAKDRQASVKTLKQMHDERADDGQRLKSQIRRSRVIWPVLSPVWSTHLRQRLPTSKTVYIAVALAELFIHIATDAPLMRGLKQQGELAWCINEHSPKQLASSLAQITASRALPITAIQDVQRAFALTQAREIQEILLCLKAHLSCSLTLPKPACCVS